MAIRREIEGDWVMGWPDRKRPEPFARKDEHGRVTYQRTPIGELPGLITPTDLRYIVAQLQMPDPVHPDDWSLTITGEVERPLRLTYDDVQQLPARTVRVVHECSGTDADFFDYLKSGGEYAGCETCGRYHGKPDRFDLTRAHTGQTSAGEFTGVPLAAVLERAGLKPNAISVRAEGFDRGTPGEHATYSADEVPQEINYDKCLPLEKALDPDTILAWALNGEYLRHVHGAPLRLIVPGWSGNWSVKWLQTLDVLDHMAPCYYQTQYFYYADSRDDPERRMITAMGVRCIIIEPRDGDSPLAPGLHVVRGLAWSGMGAITRVEVSTDGGATWQDAHIEEPREKWLWVRWSHRWEAADAGRYQILARATDEAGRVQPQTPWNFQRKNFDGIVPVDIEVA
jgi:DMSO/TMAO reductase YedYZ molybdopterin-dependent catalytic subunit